MPNSNSRSTSAQSEASADEKRNERSGNSATPANTKGAGAQSNSPQQARVRGSGFSEGDAHKNVAPKTTETGRTGQSPKGPAAAVGDPAASPSHPRTSDADDQLANGKRAPRGTNTNGGVSNEPAD